MNDEQRVVQVDANGFALAPIDSGADMIQAPATASAMRAIEASVMLAKRFPRSESNALQGIIRACKRPSFAVDSYYRFPRGGATVQGPSVVMAREIARLWGNIRTGLEIVEVTDDEVHIRGWAWDLETNRYECGEDRFKRSAQRKNKATGQTEWVAPDERDTRELVNRRGAILVRNAILHLLPSDIIDLAMEEAQRTVARQTKEDPEGQRKAIIVAFGELGISATEIAETMRCPIEQLQPADIQKLREAYKAVKDGSIRWGEFKAVMNPQEPDTDEIDPKKVASDGGEGNRGHGGEGLGAVGGKGKKS